MKKSILMVFSTNLLKTLSVLIVSFFVPSLLSLGEYADYKLFGLYASYIGVAHFGFCDGVFLHYGGKTLEDHRGQASREVSGLACLELIISLGLIAYGCIAGNLIFTALGLDILPVILVTYFAMVYQAVGEFSAYSKIYTGKALLELLTGLALVFLVKKDSGMLFVFNSVAVEWVIALYAVWAYAKKYPLRAEKPDARLMSSMMRAGILLMIGNMSYILFGSIDKWFVKLLMETDHFAYYSFAVQLLSALNMFVTPISLTLYSYLSRRKSSSFEYDLKTVILALLFFMLGGVFVIRFILSHYLQKYLPAENVIIILFMAQVFSLLNTSIYVNLFKTYKMQRKYFRNLAAIMGVSVAANAAAFFLVQRSMESIASATLASMVLWALLNLRSFGYLKLRVRHLLFPLGMIPVYFLCSALPVLPGLAAYWAAWLIALRLLMPSVYRLGLQEAKNLRDKLIHRKGRLPS